MTVCSAFVVLYVQISVSVAESLPGQCTSLVHVETVVHQQNLDSGEFVV